MIKISNDILKSGYDDKRSQMEKSAAEGGNEDAQAGAESAPNMNQSQKKASHVPVLTAKPRHAMGPVPKHPNVEQEVWHSRDRRSSVTSPSSEVEKRMQEDTTTTKLSKKEEKKKHKEEKKARKQLKKQEMKLKKKEKHKRRKTKDGDEGSDHLTWKPCELETHERHRVPLKPGMFLSSESLNDAEENVNTEQIPKMSRISGSSSQDQPGCRPISKGFASDSDQIGWKLSSLPGKLESDAEFSVGENRKSIFVETSDLNGPETPPNFASMMIPPTSIFPPTIVE